MDLVAAYFLPLVAFLVFLLVQFLSYRAYQNSLLEQFAQPPSKFLMAFSEQMYGRIRLWIYLLGLIWILVGVLGGYLLYAEGIDYRFFVRFFGLSAMIWFLFVLSPGLISVYFPRFELNSILVFGRRALGKVTFLLALIHANLGFFFSYGGQFERFYGLSNQYKIAVILGTIALLVLSLMALTSSDWMMRKIGFKRWKRLHRFGYFAFLFMLLHAFIRGTSFQSVFFSYSMVFVLLLFVLLELGATGQMLWRHRKYRPLWKSWLYIGVIFGLGVYSMLTSFFFLQKF